MAAATHTQKPGKGAPLGFKATWRLARMNLAICGIDGQIAHGDTFHAHVHKELKADFVLANLPLNVSDWCGKLLKDDKRSVYGVPTLAIRDLEGDYRTDIHYTAPAIETLYTRSRVQPGDLLISIKGTTGRIDVVPEHFHGNISRDLARIRFRDDLVPHFYKFYFQSPLGERALDLITVGTTRKEISIAPLKDLNVPVPLSPEQGRIAQILRAHLSVQLAEDERFTKLRRLKTGLMQDLLTGKDSVEPLVEPQGANA